MSHAAPPASDDRTRRVGVVGAGVTGLALTHYLADRGVDVVTFESGSEPGGVVRSREVDGRLLEYGPQRTRLVPAVEELVERFGLRSELLVANDDLPLYVYADGRLRRVPRSLATFLRTDLLSWRGKCRILAEPLTAAGRPDERAACLFARKFGLEAYRNVIEPLFGGLYGSDPAEMPAEHSLSRLLELESRTGSLLRAAIDRLVRGDETPPPVSFVSGMQTLPNALYEAHRPYVHLRSPVTSIEHADDGYVLAAGGRTTTVDDVVVTAPAPAAATILEGLEGASVASLRELTYNSLVLVFLEAEASLEGFGYQVRRDEALTTRGVTFNESLFGRDGVYTAFMGGMSDPGAVDRSDDELATVARREFRTVTGVDADVLEVTTLPDVIPAFDTSWAALEDVSLPEGVTIASNYTDRIGIPGRLRQARRIADRLAEDR
ncbi:protoporphyrinogen oxidase [Natrialbaceae archaeon AArc-T1-2]|uniref:protoporphyrinogen oxidase n=1 Tax=Natrialbaceae archaeon AArc-T1-2 TaxID=3053904 RepID=UPI00255B21CC|nr:protoporphyrinogen oxidase [Natrialbaceae archaeon AArc-T1-2]WIV67240.1 protoporphyrinogen oxidase [Natrialbaceae archaeon AArc-T1-2]